MVGQGQKHKQQNSATGTRTRVARVRAEYPNQLDYSGDVYLFHQGADTGCLMRRHVNSSSVSHDRARTWGFLGRQPRPCKDMRIPCALATTLQGHENSPSASHDPARTWEFLERQPRPCKDMGIPRAPASTLHLGIELQIGPRSLKTFS